MFRLDSVMQLKDNEEIRAIIRRHGFTLFWPLFGALLLIVVPFFLLFPLFELGWFGVAIFVAGVVSGAVIAIRALFLWNADVLIVSTDRVIDVDQHGIFSRHVTEASLHNIQDVSWERKGIWQTLFGLGSVKIQTAGASAQIEAMHVGKPQQVHELINQMRIEAPSIPKDAEVRDRRARIKRIAELMDEAGDEEVAAIERKLELAQKEKAAKVLFEEEP